MMGDRYACQNLRPLLLMPFGFALMWVGSVLWPRVDDALADLGGDD